MYNNVYAIFRLFIYPLNCSYNSQEVAWSDECFTLLQNKILCGGKTY